MQREDLFGQSRPLAPRDESGRDNGPPLGPVLPPLPPHVSSIAVRLDCLALAKPQALVFEGGDANDRELAALHFAARLNCAAPSPACGVCPACLQIAQKVYRDLIFVDGREGSIKVEDIRDIRTKIFEPPQGGGTRVIVLAEAQELTVNAANALLKSMEEPRPGNCFVLLAPLRERLLPTLVSRSWIVTLPWSQGLNDPRDPELAAAMAEWLAAFDSFVRTGSGWFERTSVKGRVHKLVALEVLLALEREVARAMTMDPDAPAGLDLIRSMDATSLRRLDDLLRQTQEAVTATVNPSLALDRLAIRVYTWTRGQNP